MENTWAICVSAGDSLLELKANEVVPPYCNAVFNTEAVLDSPLVPLYVEWEAEYPELTQSLTTTKDVSSNKSQYPRRAMGGRAPLHPSQGGSVANILRDSVGRLPESMLESVLAVDKRDQSYASMEAIPSIACRLEGSSSAASCRCWGTGPGRAVQEVVMVAAYILDGDMKYWSRDVDKAEAKGDVLEVRKYPFTMADGIVMSTEPLLHEG
ncbi:hypothetical protein FOBRF1_014911 [Fusarium oxysporum]